MPRRDLYPSQQPAPKIIAPKPAATVAGELKNSQAVVNSTAKKK
jgi:hypothetical protein